MTRGISALPSAYVRLLAASAISSLGGGLQLLAVPLLATSLTRDPRLIGALAVTSTVPSLLFAIPVGRIVDRLPRGQLLVFADLASAGVTSILVGLQLLGGLRLWELFTCSLALSTAGLLSGMSSSGYLPRIVSSDELVRANGQLATVTQLGAGIIGPGLGGAVYALSPVMPFAANGVSFLISAALVGSFVCRDDASKFDLPRSVHQPERQAQVRRLPLAVAALRGDRSLEILVVLVACSGLFGWMPEATFVLYARLVLHASATQYGVLLAVTPAGAVLGGVVLARRRRSPKLLWLVPATDLIYGALLLPPGFLTSVPGVAAVLFVQGIPLIVHGATMKTIRQQLTPPHVWGQVTALFTMVGSSTDALGLAAGGFLGHSLGLRQVWVIAGLGEMTTALVLLTARRQILAQSQQVGRPAPGQQ